MSDMLTYITFIGDAFDFGLTPSLHAWECRLTESPTQNTPCHRGTRQESLVQSFHDNATTLVLPDGSISAIWPPR